MKVPEGLTRAEQETFFRRSAADDVWDFYSRDPKFKRLLERRGYTVREDHQGFWAASIPQNALSVRRQLNLSPEERERRRELGKSHGGAKGKRKLEAKDDLRVDPNPETRFSGKE